MGCGSAKLSSKDQNDFIAALAVPPNLKNYAGDAKRTATFTKAWASAVFGGKVLNPLGDSKGKRTRYNVLDQQIAKAQINHMFGGGYYIIEQVQQAEGDLTQFYDIYILIENIKDNEQLE